MFHRYIYQFLDYCGLAELSSGAAPWCWAPRDLRTSWNSWAFSVLNRNSITPAHPSRKTDDSKEIESVSALGTLTKISDNLGSSTEMSIWRFQYVKQTIRFLVTTRHPEKLSARLMYRFLVPLTFFVMNHPPMPSSATTISSKSRTGRIFLGMAPRPSNRNTIICYLLFTKLMWKSVVPQRLPTCISATLAKAGDVAKKWYLFYSPLQTSLLKENISDEWLLSWIQKLKF